MEENNHNLLQPLLLLPSSNSATAVPPRHINDHQHVTSSFDIIMRLTIVFFIGILSLWANHEASKGFAITIVNESRDTLAGKRFHLFYVSNDEITRMVIHTSKVVENFLYSGSENRFKKRVDHIIIKLSSKNLTDRSIVVDTINEGEFVLNISPIIMEGTNFGHVMYQVVQRGMAHIWTWQGHGNVPKNLVNGFIEYISTKLGPNQDEPLIQLASSCNWKHDDAKVVVDFLENCERNRPGFIRRLNQEMKDEWHDRKLEIALDLPIQNLCANNRSGLGTTFELQDSYLSTSE